MVDWTDEELIEDAEQGMFEHFRLNVDAGQVPIRIDKFMSAHLEDTSRNRIQCAIKEGYVKVGEKTAKANLLVRPGDVIRFVMPYRRRGVDLVPQNIPLDIVYEDDDVLVVNKPAGMVVHPGHGHFDGTLVNALLFHFSSASSAEVSVSDADAISAHGCSGRGPSETGGAVRPARAADTATAAVNAGEIRTDGNRLFVAAGDNWLEIKELQMAGKKRMSADAFLRGFREAESYKFV